MDYAKQCRSSTSKAMTRTPPHGSSTFQPVPFDAGYTRAVSGFAARPQFRDWPLDLGEAAARFFSSTGDHRSRLQAVLPPGFAEGREGAFLRATRAFLLPDENGLARSTYQALQNSAGPQSFRAGIN